MKPEKKAEWKGTFKGIGISVVILMVMVGGAMGVTHITDSDITIDGVSVLLSSSFLNASKINTGTLPDGQIPSSISRDSEWDTQGEVETIWSTTLATDTELSTANTSMKGYVDAQDNAQDACSEITGCVENAITDGNTNWENDYGFVTSADDTVSGTELDGVFSANGFCKRTGAATYTTVAELADGDVSNTLTCSALVCTGCIGATELADGFDACGDCDATFVNEAQENSISSGMVAFNYAASASEGGAATTGDSAASFFSTGTFEDARLDSTITRDSEWNTLTEIETVTSKDIIDSTENNDDDVSASELDDIFTTVGFLKRTGAAAYAIITDNSSNWNTAFGWGDHSIVGYLTSVAWGDVTGKPANLDEDSTDDLVDSDFGSEGIMKTTDGAGAYSTITDSSSNWNNAYGWGNHSTEGYIDGSSLNAANLTGTVADARIPNAFLKDGTRSMSGNINLNSNHIQNTNLIYGSSASYYLDFSSSGILSSTLQIQPATDNAHSLGAPGKRWSDLYAVTEHIGDIREFYTYNPGYTYSVGDVVAMDITVTYDVKPSAGLRSRVIGVVAALPEESIVDMVDVAIYGKFSPVKVTGTINAGDYLVASGTSGVATSMYNRPHPILPTLLPASTNPDVYNTIAKMLPTVGIAFEGYNSTEVGTIELMLGK